MLKTKTVVIVAVLLLAIAAVAGAGVNSVASAPQGDSEERVEVEAVTLKHYGFEPSEITRRRGPFTFALHNNSGTRDLTFRLGRRRGERVTEIRLGRGGRRSHRTLNLPPGEYLLTESNHPDWQFRLTITN